MGLNESELLSGETVVLGKSAKVIVRADGAGLGRFASDHVTEVTGVVATDAAEVMGGRLYLTNFRLVFRAGGSRRPRGRISILLPTIRDMRHTAVGRRWQLEVVTGTRRYTFVVRGGVIRLIALIVLRSDANAEQTRRLARAAVAELPKICGSPGAAQRIEAARGALTTLAYGDAAAAISQDPAHDGDPVEASGALNLAELLRDERCG